MVVDFLEPEQFFAPAPTDLVSSLVSEYNAYKGHINNVADFMAGSDAASALGFFISGNANSERGSSTLSLTCEQLFRREGAVAALNARYWSKALQLTDVMDIMPEARRNEWHEQIRNPEGRKKSKYDKEWEIHPLPDFTIENVRSSLLDLLAKRSMFFAERVDGIFRGLSGDHVTNQPQGFGKRMIIANVIDSFNLTNYRRTGLINDLRCVVARFMGRDEPGRSASDTLIHSLRGRYGEWVSVDGGAIRVRLYKKGTAHLEVHPDMAWRLNCILAQLYPMAIPAQFRQRPARKSREWELMQRPLPAQVCTLLSSIKQAQELNPNRHQYRQSSFISVKGAWEIGRSDNKHAVAEACRVLEMIGGVRHPDNASWWQFDFDPIQVVTDIAISGMVPDQRSHQFYPTPADLATTVAELAEVGADHTVLEPSAGLGGLAAFLPADRTDCVEVSALHAKVLEAKGYRVDQCDFLALPVHKQYDRVVMNPPFDQGRWQAHIEHAAKFVKPGGRLVAVLPSGAQSRLVLPGASVQRWHGSIHNAFADASVSVVLLQADF